MLVRAAACDVNERRHTVHHVDDGDAKSALDARARDRSRVAAERVQGAQSVSRALRVLKLVAGEGRGGCTAADVAARLGFSRPTAFRLLSALRAEGLLDWDAEAGRWHAGPELYLLGKSAEARFDVTGIARDIVRSLAAKTEESAFLSTRSGDESVCLVHEDGAFPIRSHVLSPGVRFPLGVASAGLVLLAFADRHDVDAYFERHPDLERRWGAAHAEAEIRRRLAETVTRGFALNPGLIVEGSYGIGAAVFDRRGEARWALSITGVEFRFGTDRLPELGRILLAHAHLLSTRLAATGH